MLSFYTQYKTAFVTDSLTVSYRVSQI